jgi:6-pyruvoyltetrahydropterin/6-carboxytetrahydropterin synthase
MRAKIAKNFNWEMSHRLPYHKAGCRNIHGHSYKMRVELEGTLDEFGMVLDYYQIKQIVMPLVNKLDHCFLCDPDDDLMINFLKENDFRYLIMDNFTTAENIVHYILYELKKEFSRYDNLDILKVRLQESAEVFAEDEINLK